MICRIFTITLVLLAIALAGQPSHAIDITLSGAWSITIDSDDLVADTGSDLTSSYQSVADQALVDVTNTAGGGDNWRIDVKKSDIYWHANMHVYTKRTSSGTGGSVSGGSSFLEITNSDQSFFTGSDDVLDIGLQYKIDGVSIDISPNNYTTNIIYTVVDT